MGKFCSKCGNPLGEEVHFCGVCGSPAGELSVAPVNEPVEATSDDTERPQRVQESSEEKTGRQLSDFIVVNATTAPIVAGQIAVGDFYPLSSVTNISNPLKTILSGVKRTLTSFKNVFKNKKGLIIAIVLASVWIILTMLPMLGIDPMPIKIASWLTFAQGGLKGGVLGFVGGIIGKGMLASLLFSFVSRGKGTLRDIKEGSTRLRALFKGGSLDISLLGFGVALMLFNIMAGISSPMQSMAGIIGSLLSLKALGGGGSMRRLAMSVTANKNGKIRTKNTVKCTALLSGLTLGFAVSAAISLIPWGYIPYCLGAIAIVTGVILSIIRRNKKEVAAQ